MTRQEFAHQLAQYRLQSTRRLPIAYQEVEYLESTGTQYIDTGVLLTNRHKIELCFSATAKNDLSCVFGYGESNPYYPSYEMVVTASQYNNVLGYRYSSRTGRIKTIGASAADYAHMHCWKLDRSKLYRDGVFQVDTGEDDSDEWVSDYSALLFASRKHDGGIAGFSLLKAYSLKIYDGNIIIRYFVPCYRVSDNVAGLYDLVNGAFYTNAGIGTFVTGPDVGKGSIKFDGGIKCYLPSVKFYGACTQDGTPTPEAPVPIKCNDSKWTMNGSGGTVDLSLLPDGGLYGIGNVRDEWDAATGKGIRRCGKINSYAGETVGDNWISSTGALTTGATVVYELSEPVLFTATPQPIIEQNGSNQLSQTDGDIDDIEAEATFVTHS